VQHLAYMIFVHRREQGRDMPTSAASAATVQRRAGSRWIAAIARDPASRRDFGNWSATGPIEYLTRWRMLLAGRSVSRGEPIGAIARSLGYESESAFSTAFKRVMGRTPRHHARLAAVA
jgi:methylphosphotriester-DNA--protein-cysteine methyltransferase